MEMGEGQEEGGRRRREGEKEEKKREKKEKREALVSRPDSETSSLRRITTLPPRVLLGSTQFTNVVYK